MPESDSDAVVPAQLSFLAIYNPTLGPTGETIEDQIVFYTSRSDLQRRTEGVPADEGNGKIPDVDVNERQRQIGLAQGMVSFARWESLINPQVDMADWSFCVVISRRAKP